jgi:hypothetical protein
MAHDYPGPFKSQLWETAWASLNVVEDLGLAVKNFLRDDLRPLSESLQMTRSVCENFCYKHGF